MTDGPKTGPISYSIDASLGVIFTTWRGRISADDVKQHWTRYLANPDVMALRKSLADIREAEILFTGLELRSLIRSVVMPALNGRNWTTAIVVSAPVQFGVARQYNVFAEPYSKDAIFDDPEAALCWLRSPTNDVAGAAGHYYQGPIF